MRAADRGWSTARATAAPRWESPPAAGGCRREPQRRGRTGVQPSLVVVCAGAARAADYARARIPPAGPKGTPREDGSRDAQPFVPDNRGSIREHAHNERTRAAEQPPRPSGQLDQIGERPLHGRNLAARRRAPTPTTCVLNRLTGPAAGRPNGYRRPSATRSATRPIAPNVVETSLPLQLATTRSCPSAGPGPAPAS